MKSKRGQKAEDTARAADGNLCELVLLGARVFGQRVQAA